MAADLERRAGSDLDLGRAAQTDLIPLFLLRYDRAHTRRSYASDLRQFFGSETVTLEMARAISFAELNSHLEALDHGGARPNTLHRRVATLRGFFAWLIALGLLTQNPADRQLVRRIRRTSRDERTVTVLTREQARALLDAIPPERDSAVRDRVLISTMLHCVLRRSEAAAMDFDHVRPVGAYWVLDLPLTKGGADQYVKMPLNVRDAIEAMRAHYGYGSGPVWRSHSHNSLGNRLSAFSIYKIVKEAAERAGVHGAVGAHTLRHTGCTLAIESGASIQQVQAHARHKNLETTMIYVHQRDRLRDSAADFIDF